MRAGGLKGAAVGAIFLIAAGVRAADAPEPTVADVVRREGQPSSVWFDATGREVWEYGANPYRFTGLRFVFDDQGRLVYREQTREARDISRIEARRSTRREVREILGEPLRLYTIRGEIHWEWPVFWVARIPHRLVIQFDDRGIVKDIGKYRLTIRSSGVAN